MSDEFDRDETPAFRPPPRAGRELLAAATGIAVVIAGAIFLTLMGAPQASLRSGDVAQPLASAEGRADVAVGDYGAIVWPKAAATVSPAPIETAVVAAPDVMGAPEPSALTDAVSTPVDAGRYGAPIRVKPQRASAIDTRSGPPRLKPSLGAATPPPSPAPDAPAAVLSLATLWLADERDRPPPFFFESDLVADRNPPPPLAVAYAQDITSPPRDVRVTLSKGETFVDALRRAGVRAEDRNEAAYAFGKLYNLRTLRPGQAFDLTIAEPNKTLYELLALDEAPAMHLLALDYNADPEKRISLARSPDGGFAASTHAAPLTTRIAAVNGRIDGSLYLSAKRQGAPDEVIAGLAQMFAYDVDFQREIFGGDEFEAIFEVRYDETGRLVAGGEVLYGRLNWRGKSKEKGYYRFAAEEGGRADYYDASGESARRLLMKTPIDGARLSSGFGTRRHPILGYAKAHKGVDFAAARGTPIMAAGDGVVEKAGPYGSFGNYVRIRHAQGYATAYAHMNAIKKGVRAGARVRQGDVIGTVGSTGRSTGPHLHYEVHLKNVAVNPQSLKIATGVNLGGKDLARFRQVRDRIDAMRPAPADAEPNLVAENAKNRSL
ncbi:MAG: peptidoglycan DD-metalloendopeptidase family protein [Parvularculaceae bacterium]|nr:peptidoglycan DD-metalloendopeptidase family protein [Parvularculaceae bacterium]